MVRGSRPKCSSSSFVYLSRLLAERLISAYRPESSFSPRRRSCSFDDKSGLPRLLMKRSVSGRAANFAGSVACNIFRTSR